MARPPDRPTDPGHRKRLVRKESAVGQLQFRLVNLLKPRGVPIDGSEIVGHSHVGPAQPRRAHAGVPFQKFGAPGRGVPVRKKVGPGRGRQQKQ
jgi:hypothetical protein